MVLNIVLVLLLPKVFSIENFGYWQLFLFFSSYVGFFHFGLNDGIYLRYGGKSYDRINKSLLKGQFLVLFFSQIILVFIAWLIFSFTNHSEDYRFVFYASLFYLLVSNLSSFITFLLQSINRLRQFSWVMLVINFFSILFFSVLLFHKEVHFKPYVIAYNIAYFMGALLCFFMVWELFLTPLKNIPISVIWKETMKSVSAGSKLLISNISSMLIIGVGRFLIEKKWGIEEFAKVSLAITFATFFIFFIRQASLVLFPALKNADSQRKKNVFKNGLQYLNVLMLGSLLLFPLLEIFIHGWIPKYSSNIPFLILLLPVCIFEGKVQVLLNTYMKVERMESQLMRINVFSMILSFILSLVAFYFQSVIFIIAVIPFSIMIKCLYMEWVLKKKFQLAEFYKEIEVIILSLFFVLLFFYFDHKVAYFFYFCGYLIYLFFNRSVLTEIFGSMKQI